MKRIMLATVFALACTLMFANIALGQLIAPQGRLTLQSNTPVMTSDVMNTSIVYYTPYNGLSYPDFLGGQTDSFKQQLTLTLTSSDNPAGNVYDVFLVFSGGSTPPTICTGPAWASLTSRGTGAGTTQIQQHFGFWWNANIINNCYNNGANVASFVANAGLYVGSIYTTGPGETSMQFKPTPYAGGTANTLGLYNAYNQVPIVSVEADSNGGPCCNWTYATAAWRAADGNSNNSITFLDGLRQSAFTAQYQTMGITGTAGTQSYTQIGIDGTGTDGSAAVFSYGFNNSTPALLSSPPLLGLHFVEANEYAGSNTTFGQGVMALTLQLSM